MASAPAPEGGHTNPVAGTDPFAEGAQSTHIADVFGFDPEDEDVEAADQGTAADASDLVPETPAGGDETPAGSSVGAGEGEGEALEGASPEPAPAPTPPSEDKLKISSLEARLEALQKQLDERPAQPQADPTQPKPEAAQPAKPAPLAIEVPAEIAEAITSGDDEQMVGAINNIVSTLATQIRDAAMICLTEVAELRKLVEGGTTSSTPSTSSTNAASETDIEATKARMKEDYFTAFPAHKAVEFQPILAAVAGEMAAEFPGHEWNADYINAMGARVADRAKRLAGLMNPNGKPPASPLPAGPRSATPQAGDGDISDEVMDTLNSWG